MIGDDLWLVPRQAVSRPTKINKFSGAVTAYSTVPYTPSSDNFQGWVFDGVYLWCVPYTASHVLKLDPTNGVMTGYNGFVQSLSAVIAQGCNIPHLGLRLLLLLDICGRPWQHFGFL